MAPNPRGRPAGKSPAKTRSKAPLPKPPRQPKAPKVQVQQLAKRVAKAESAARGPRPAVRHTVTATLGTIGPNTSSGTELEYALPLHPGLVKETAAVNSFGPLQSAVGQYSMWRLVSFHIHLTPMVGSSAISGTVYRVSLNLSGQPTSTAWSGLGARQHRDASPGSHLRWQVSDSILSGPKATWWYSNTNAPGVASLGPVMEVHSIGQTMSSYQAKPFDGPVFLLEIRGTWEFVNYAAAPALSLLSSGKGTGTLQGGQGDPLTIKVNEPHLATFIGRQAGSAPSGVGEVIYMVVDTAVTAIADTAAPPWSWMIRAGWWFARALIGSTNGPGVLQLYSSFDDAQNNRPCILSGDASGDLGSLKITQLTTPSSGLSALNDGIVGMPSPGTQPIAPGADFSLPVSLSPILQHLSFPGGFWARTNAGQIQGAIQCTLAPGKVANFIQMFQVTNQLSPGFGFEGVLVQLEISGPVYPVFLLGCGNIHYRQGSSNTFLNWWLIRSSGFSAHSISNRFNAHPAFTPTTEAMITANWTGAELHVPETTEGYFLLIGQRGEGPETASVKGHSIQYLPSTETQFVYAGWDWFRFGPTTAVLQGTALGDGVYGTALSQRLALLSMHDASREVIHNTSTGPAVETDEEDQFLSDDDDDDSCPDVELQQPALGAEGDADDGSHSPGSQ
ncbi:structural polyprotein [Bastrovirus 3]|nr:structural polyprotein [Bastrovirus 3]